MQSLRLYFDCISACNWSFFKSHFSPALWGQNSVFSQSKRIHSDIVFSFQLLWKASSQRHMPFPNHHSRPIFRLQAAFLAFSLRSKSKFPDTARLIPAYLGGQSVENLAGSGRSRMFSDEGNPNAHGRRAIRFPRLQRPLWKHPEMAVFFRTTADSHETTRRNKRNPLPKKRLPPPATAHLFLLFAFIWANQSPMGDSRAYKRASRKACGHVQIDSAYLPS